MAHLPAIPDPGALDAAADPASYIITSCERAKAWLAQALAGDHIEAIAEAKCQAEAMRIYTMQKQLGKDAELAATEIVRRAERCIGLAIRKGQAAGRIARRGEHLKINQTRTLLSPNNFLGDGNQTRTETYALADGVPDDQFEGALEEARAEHNLSRANVVRKIKGNGDKDRWRKLQPLAETGYTSRQIADELGVSAEHVRRRAREMGVEIQADKTIGRTRAVKHDRILREFVSTLESLTPSCDMIEPDKIKPFILEESLEILQESTKHLRKLQQRLKGALYGTSQ